MATPEREALERELRERCDRGDHDGAAKRAIEGYGPEIYGFLVALMHDEEDAADVFSIVCENLWRSLPKFAWGCTMRTWAYTIARNASVRYRKAERRRARGAVPVSALDDLSALAAQVRTQTRSFLKTAHKDRFARLRESLPAEDRMLLVLRVDRQLAWNELALVMHDASATEDGSAGDDETLKREAARLRKRFQLVKEKLVEMGRREGLIPTKDE